MSSIARNASVSSIHSSSSSHHSHQHSSPPPNNTFGNHPQFETFDTDVEDDGLERHLSLFDLTSIGVGGTVGSGIFVLTGQIAHDYAGPATFVSWTLAGCAAFSSGLAFAELAARIPHSGSTYAYARLAGGKPAAVVAAACLTLECMCCRAMAYVQSRLPWSRPLVSLMYFVSFHVCLRLQM